MSKGSMTIISFFNEKNVEGMLALYINSENKIYKHSFATDVNRCHEIMFTIDPENKLDNIINVDMGDDMNIETLIMYLTEVETYKLVNIEVSNKLFVSNCKEEDKEEEDKFGDKIINLCIYDIGSHHIDIKLNILSEKSCH